MANQIFPFGCPVGNHKKSLNLRPVCYVLKQGGLFTYSMIVYIKITLFILEGISRKGHMKLLTKRLEQKLNQMKTFPKASSIVNFINLPTILFVERTNLAAYLLVDMQRLVLYDVIKPRDCM